MTPAERALRKRDGGNDARGAGAPPMLDAMTPAERALRPCWTQ